MDRIKPSGGFKLAGLIHLVDLLAPRTVMTRWLLLSTTRYTCARRLLEYYYYYHHHLHDRCPQSFYSRPPVGVKPRRVFFESLIHPSDQSRNMFGNRKRMFDVLHSATPKLTKCCVANLRTRARGIKSLTNFTCRHDDKV